LYNGKKHQIIFAASVISPKTAQSKQPPNSRKLAQQSGHPGDVARRMNPVEETKEKGLIREFLGIGCSAFKNRHTRGLILTPYKVFFSLSLSQILFFK
jgi:hypothetical protein